MAKPVLRTWLYPAGHGKLKRLGAPLLMTNAFTTVTTSTPAFREIDIESPAKAEDRQINHTAEVPYTPENNHFPCFLWCLALHCLWLPGKLPQPTSGFRDCHDFPFGGPIPDARACRKNSKGWRRLKVSATRFSHMQQLIQKLWAAGFLTPLPGRRGDLWRRRIHRGRVYLNKDFEKFSCSGRG